MISHVDELVVRVASEVSGAAERLVSVWRDEKDVSIESSKEQMPNRKPSPSPSLSLSPSWPLQFLYRGLRSSSQSSRARAAATDGAEKSAAPTAATRATRRRRTLRRILTGLFFFSVVNPVTTLQFSLSSFPSLFSFPSVKKKSLLAATREIPQIITMARKQLSVLLLLVAALVAAAGVALVAFSPATVFARSLLDWEDDLRPKAGDHSSDDSDYKLFEINYPCEELAKWSVGEFNDRRLGPRVSFDDLNCSFSNAPSNAPSHSIDRRGKKDAPFCCPLPVRIVARDSLQK